MSTDPPPEKNMYIIDPESPAEMARLINQDRFMTQAMGGPLVGVPDPSALHNVLDLGCGPGGWVLDVAFEYPQVEVAGVDISKIMINYANARASSQQLSNASFEVMNITHPLEFPDEAFDMVNARFLFGSLLRDVWPRFITECTRLLRPGGILRLTELIDMGVSTSPAFERLNALSYQALWRAGYCFSSNGSGLYMTPLLPQLLRTAEYQDIRHLSHALDVSKGTPTWIGFYRNLEIGYKLAQPLYLKTKVTTQEEFERLHQQALVEMCSDDFFCMWHFMTFLGTKP